MNTEETPTDVEEVVSDVKRPRGVALRESEWAEIDAMAKEYGTSSHAMSVLLLRYGVKSLKADLYAGKVKTKVIEVISFDE